MPTIKAGTITVLSVRQPHADDLIYGDKQIELRSWRTHHRGRLYIHASRWEDSGPMQSCGPGRTGAIIGVVDLVACFNASDLAEVTAALDEHIEADDPAAHVPECMRAVARWYQDRPADEDRVPEGDDVFWLVANPKALDKPITCKGRLNLWTLQADANQLTTKR